MPQRPTINIKIYNMCKRSLHSNIVLFWSYRLPTQAVFHYNYCSLIHGAIKDTNHWQLSRQSLSTKFTQVLKLRTCGKQHCRKYSSSLYSRELLPSHTHTHVHSHVSKTATKGEHNWCVLFVFYDHHYVLHISILPSILLLLNNYSFDKTALDKGQGAPVLGWEDTSGPTDVAGREWQHARVWWRMTHSSCWSHKRSWEEKEVAGF